MHHTNIDTEVHSYLILGHDDSFQILDLNNIYMLIVILKKYILLNSECL